MPAPRVLIPTSQRRIDSESALLVFRPYVDAARLAGTLPLLLPSPALEHLDDCLDLADGLLLSGDEANIHPSHFGQAVLDPKLPLDLERDAMTLPLLRRAVERNLPVLAICRGAQELNVALGGTLHQAVHELDGHRDHREPAGQPLEVLFAPAHPVDATPQGLLATTVGSTCFMVNSLHGQAADRLADGLTVEARARDGVVEAFSVAPRPGDRHPRFQLALQWHPEWAAATNPQSMAMLRAFGDACRAWQARRAEAASARAA